MNLVCLMGAAKFLQLYDARSVADSPGDDLSGMFPVIGFDDRPAAMSAIVTSPFEVVEIARGVDLFDDRIAVTCIVW